jgi:hypothetical protein
MNSPCSAAPPPGDHEPPLGTGDNRIGREILAKVGAVHEGFTEEVNNHHDHERPTEDCGDVATRMTPICPACGLPQFGGEDGCVHCAGTGPWRWSQIPGSGGGKR